MQVTGSNIQDIIKEPHKYTLSIRVCSDGFCFLVSEADVNKFLFASEMKCGNSSLIETLELAVETNSLFILPFAKKQIVFHCFNYQCVPTSLLSAHAIAEAQQIITKPAPPKQIPLTGEKIFAAQRFVAQTDAELYQTLQRLFPHCTTLIHAELLANYVEKLARTEDSSLLYLHSQGETVDIVAATPSGMKYAMSFHFDEPLELVYFAMGAWKECDFDPQQAKITLSLPPDLSNAVEPSLRLYAANVCNDRMNYLINVEGIQVPLDTFLIHL